MAALDFPDNPAAGDLYGSSGTVWRWDGARWASTAGASGARGRVAYAQIVASQTGIAGTEVDIANLFASFTADPSRTYRTTVYAEISSTVANDAVILYLRDWPSGAQKARAADVVVNSGIAVQVMAQIVETGLSGSITRKATAQRIIGTGSLSVLGGPTFPAFILVEDITYEAGSGGPGGIDKMPLGMLSFNNGPASVQSGIGSAVSQLAGMLVTGNLVAGRWYRVRTAVNVQKDGTGVAFVYLSIRDSPMTTVYRENLLSLEANEWGNLVTDYTFKAGATATMSFFTGVKVNTGTVAYYGTAPYTGWISLEDMGAQL